ncbi:hypothetical protein GGR95_003557 [Sulfitobacter undariae]|uniref:Methyltransferase domain-containing protein n=2 Tax=Sulfitobacter undariae TaxID=1563671 RepID=A0A7W6E9H0_9RHOB|nr:hypothetical protein [Sulfitobacter undariae]
MPSEKNDASDVAAQQALAQFENAIDLLDSYQGAGGEMLPALPLMSLLEQCEAVLETQSFGEGSCSVLYALPGVPALEPEWWAQHFIGLTVRRLTACDMNDAGFSAWVGAIRAAGTPLILTATPDIVLPDEVAPDVVSLLMCHPYRAFHAQSRAGGITLSDYCADVLRDLEAKPNLKPTQIEILEDVPAYLRRSLALPETVTSLFECDRGLDRSVAVPPYFEGESAYNKLCDRFDYSPSDLPVLAGRAVVEGLPTYRMTQEVTGAASPALISEFMARAARVQQRLDPSADFLDGSAIAALVDRCVAAGDEGFLDMFDQGVDQLGHTDRALAYLAGAAHFKATGKGSSALSFVGSALLLAPVEAAWLRILIASAYAELNNGKSAVLALASDALAPKVLDDAARNALDGLVSDMLGTKQGEHGHALLIDALEKEPAAPKGRRRVLIEIGTTRELVLGQGSTQKLAALCVEHDLDFITVDMDPRNTRNAARMFAREGYDFKAVTSKGEDYLAQYEGQIDYIFLDAYDSDHGSYSEASQDCYAPFIRSSIVQERPHKVHLDCVEVSFPKMVRDGLICICGTWTSPQGGWTSKGATAMPYLLQNGFELIEARNNAALLRPVPAAD